MIDEEGSIVSTYEDDFKDGNIVGRESATLVVDRAGV